jgi:hypothetical protein
MPLVVTVVRGYTFDTVNGETVTLAKLNLLGTLGITLAGAIDDTDFGEDSLARSRVKSAPDMWGTDAGEANAHDVTTAPNQFTALADGIRIGYLVNAGPNTGAVTVDVDGLGAKAIQKKAGLALVAGDLKAGQMVFLQYDAASDAWLMINPTARAVEVNDGAAANEGVFWDGANWVSGAFPYRATKYDSWSAGEPAESLDALGTSGAGQTQVAHGLGAIPDLVRVTIVCRAADGDFAEDDEVEISGVNNNGGGVIAASVRADATNVTINHDFAIADGVSVLADNGANTPIDQTKWKLRVYAIRLITP